MFDVPLTRSDLRDKPVKSQQQPKPCTHGRRLQCCMVAALAALALQLLATSTARGQIAGLVNQFQNAPGVYLDINGKVCNRQVDEKDQLAAMRARLKAAGQSANKDKLVYLSLPKLLAEVRTLHQQGKDIPERLRYLGGMTQLRYVLVFPDQKDLVIAGPAEPWAVVHGQDDSTDFVVGKRTGRPVLQLDDLIVALRTAREGRGRVFGCGIYPSPDSVKIADEIAHRMIRNTRGERMLALRDNLGPQEVRIFGAQADTRLAYICVAADYEMKRFALGVDRSPIAGLGSAIDNTRSAANKFWFEASYEPLLVSKDGLAYEIRGQRLGLGCGAFDFDPRGATDTAKHWAAKFAKDIPQLAAAVPLFAELQNVADEAFLGNLLIRDGLAEKIDWDNAWIYDDAACPVARIPTPKTCETLVSFTNGSMVAGGVTLTLPPFMEDKSREPDAADALQTPKAQFTKLREAASPSGGSSIFTEN